ncbi:MAG: hypothetical protein HY730_05485 [Candidatus Tectomicrobia bacterium]|uniref:Uncharacterized protein n=1 Tax=Tectimicrobiota bacterium TaxID=2528274 RepID=A0A933LQZ2_UNCTE|nr:hypothetical protein [Candidatus Tectomicrobia bacterium]
MNNSTTISEVDTYGLLAQAMLIAMLAGMAKALAPLPKRTTPLLPATTSLVTRNEPEGAQEKPSVSPTKLVRIPAQLRRQRDKYIRHWTEAMFKPE